MPRPARGITAGNNVGTKSYWTCLPREDSNELTLCHRERFETPLVAIGSVVSLERPNMTNLARKLPESAHVTSFLANSIDLASEKHYSVIEISKLWALSQKTVRRIFEREPGVIQWGSMETRHKRGYRTLRVPETVLLRVHRKLRRAS